MKQPVLRVKKGKESYDDRPPRGPVPPGRGGQEGNDAERSRDRPRRRGMLFRMRRGSLMPLLILVVLAAVLLRVIPRSASRANLEGWHAALQARVLMDTLEVGVAFTRLGGVRENANDAPATASVLFVLPDTGEQTEAFGELSGSRVALRTRMRYIASEKVLRAVVNINGELRTLSLPLKGSVMGK